MHYKIGDKMLVTCDNWFYTPDGNTHRAVFGTVKGIHSDKTTLGIKTNDKSTNWYLEIGNMFIAGCQIHYAVKTDKVIFKPHIRLIEEDAKLLEVAEPISHIYDADKEK